jgi:hypothetical protein
MPIVVFSPKSQPDSTAANQTYFTSFHFAMAFNFKLASNIFSCTETKISFFNTRERFNEYAVETQQLARHFSYTQQMSIK